MLVAAALLGEGAASTSPGADTPKSNGFAHELRLTRWTIAAKASQRQLTRAGLLVLIAAALLVAGTVVCLALNVGQGVGARKDSPPAFDVAAFAGFASFVLAGLSLLWPRERIDNAGASLRGDDVRALPADKVPWCLAAAAFVALSLGIGFGLYATVQSV